MLRPWLVPLLLVACAPAAAETRPPDPSGRIRIVIERQPPVGDRGCGVLVEQAPGFTPAFIRLGPEPGALPYTTDGRSSAYTLTHGLALD